MHALDNPFWSALHSIHRDIARVQGEVARYPAEFAPFVGVANAEVEAGDAFAALLAADESAYLLGVAPRLEAGWQLQFQGDLAQMVCESPIALRDGPEILPLGEAQRGDVLALTAQVYPHYFRERTMALGRYFGMYVADASGEVRLAAMIGERLGCEGAREMSAICTHPDFLGRGYAQRLTAWLTNDTLARGQLPFLHVSYQNPRAKGLYGHMGYRLRRDIPFWALRRGA